eukprot:TRINITY_DN111108_c0_g1_i1.p1 TRINITY_DN111108_c0_g1~~TRINITY_DN111108_c0_g1_i1.p1  ORF type:complete len:1061 (+),score=267.68 TRINITY_DN111108_c0_g1_i1:137-3184(+)
MAPPSRPRSQNSTAFPVANKRPASRADQYGYDEVPASARTTREPTPARSFRTPSPGAHPRYNCGISMKQALGVVSSTSPAPLLPQVPGSAASRPSSQLSHRSDQLRSLTPHGMRPAIPEDRLALVEADMTEEDLTADSVSGPPDAHATSRSSSAAARHGAVAASLDAGMEHISDLMTWMRPRTKDGDFFSPLVRLSVEVNQAAQHWSAYRSGHCRPSARSAAAALHPPPLDSERTSQACSLLLRLTRAFTAGSPMRIMLEPIVQEVVESIYQDFTLPCLAALSEAEMSSEALDLFPTFFALVGGYKKKYEDSVVAHEKLTAELKRQRAVVQPLEEDVASLRKRVKDLITKMETDQARAEDAEKRLLATQDAFDNFRHQTKIALQDYHEVQHNMVILREDLRSVESMNNEKEQELKKLRGSVTELTHTNLVRQDKIQDLTETLEKQQSSMEAFETMKEQLDRYEHAEAGYGMSVCTRVVEEVFGREMKDFCPKRIMSKSNLQNAADLSQHSKRVVDYVVTKLTELPRDIGELTAHIKRLKLELKDCKSLIPVWNKEYAEDLADAYNPEAPIHTQIFSNRDKRSFAGLGHAAEVPPYLRADGFVKHLFISKAECEQFMSAFLDELLSEEKQTQMEGTLSCEAMHGELYEYMKATLRNSDELTEFAYAFIAGLETFRDDPDFELFDLMLSGVVHPFITLDQRDMLQSLYTLVRGCQEGHTSDNRHHRHSSQVASKEQVSRRVVRAVLTAVFPEKPASRQNALQRALHLTLQTLAETGSSASPDCVFISDLFSQGADGSQTLFIEEVRRQHCYEIIEYAQVLTRALTNKAKEISKNGDWPTDVLHVTDRQLKQVILQIDPFVPQTTLDQMIAVGCPEREKKHAVGEVLRRLRTNMLLKPTKLWIKPEPNDVLQILLSAGHSEEAEKEQPTPSKQAPVSRSPPQDAEGAEEGGPPPEEGGDDGNTTSGSPAKRCRAVKVVDNPLAKMKSNVYNTVEGLQKPLGGQLSEPSDEADAAEEEG